MAQNIRLDVKQISWMIVLCMCLVGVIPAVSAYFSDDQESPILDYVSPANGEIFVDVSVTIEAYVFDPDIAFGIPGSGVDFQSVEMLMKGKPVPFFIDDLGNNKVYIHTNLPASLPYLSWIDMELKVSDNAGNTMPAYRWEFLTEPAPDTTPPEITNLSPPDGSSAVVVNAQIYCKIRDNQSGVDVSSITMHVDGKPVIYSVINLFDEVKVVYQAPEPFPYETSIPVRVSVKDFAGNTSVVSWSFTTQTIPIGPAQLLHPEANDFLNYQLEEGIIVFSWTYDPRIEYYRLIIKFVDYPCMEKMDLGPDDYIFVDENTIEMHYGLTERDWQDISELGDISWFIVKLDGENGNPVSPKSEIWFFRLADPDSVVIRSPTNNTKFYKFDTPPIFVWDPFDNAVSYMFGLAQIGVNGELIGRIVTAEIDASDTTFTFEPEYWKGFDNGRYMWTVVANLPNGSRSDFYNLYFYKFSYPNLGVPFPIAHN
ncbi:Ig-like domain-containing protein [bacterium]|nr:Ig-like domain-containing protein [candidate division CSSED10-310 bacterium]